MVHDRIGNMLNYSHSLTKHILSLQCSVGAPGYTYFQDAKREIQYDRTGNRFS
jgi:hypothetical protein